MNQERMFLNQDWDFHLSVKLKVKFVQKIINIYIFLGYSILNLALRPL